MNTRPFPSQKYEYASQPFFDGNGFDSNVRVIIGERMVPQAVFPGLQQAGNESGANGPLYAVNAAGAPILEINRRYTDKGILKEYIR